MSPERLRVEDLDGGLRVLTLDNPSRRNALDEALLDALSAALSLDQTKHVRALLIRGAGGVFCSGYDLGALPAPSGLALPDDHLGEVMAQLAAHPAPSVALVDGPAFGAGCELAITCDFRIGTAATVFCMPPAKLGIVYAPEGLTKLRALIGLSRAKRMFFTGMRVKADQAREWALLDELVAAEDAETVALQLCRDIAQNAPSAVSGMKGIFSALSHVHLTPAQHEAIREQRRTSFLSEDAKEGRAAFLEKRAPKFNGG